MHRICLSVFGIFVLAGVFGLGHGFGVERRSVAVERGADDYPDYQLGVKYDEYPMIVPKKRTALLVNRLMVALKEAIDEEQKEYAGNKDYLSKTYADMTPEDIRSRTDTRYNQYNTTTMVQRSRIHLLDHNYSKQMQENVNDNEVTTSEKKDVPPEAPSSLLNECGNDSTFINGLEDVDECEIDISIVAYDEDIIILEDLLIQ